MIITNAPFLNSFNAVSYLISIKIKTKQTQDRNKIYIKMRGRSRKKSREGEKWSTTALFGYPTLILPPVTIAITKLIKYSKIKRKMRERTGGEGRKGGEGGS